VVTVKKENEIALVDELKKLDVKFSKLGFVEGNEVTIDGQPYGSISEFKNLYDTSIEKVLGE